MPVKRLKQSENAEADNTETRLRELKNYPDRAELKKMAAVIYLAETNKRRVADGGISDLLKFCGTMFFRRAEEFEKLTDEEKQVTLGGVWVS